MLRLTGLPSLSLCPTVEVSCSAATLELHFGGAGVRRLVVVPVGLLGTDDPELAGLQLLADLRRAGYEASRRSPDA